MSKKISEIEDYKNSSDGLFYLIFDFTNEDFKDESNIEYIKKCIETLNNNSTGLWYVYKEFKERLFGHINLPEMGIDSIYSDIKNWDITNLDKESSNDDVVKNLHTIKKINSDFYYKIAFIYLLLTKENSVDETTKVFNKIMDPNNGIDKLTKKVDTNSKKITNLEQTLELKIKRNVYSEFITILGIFTAITFAIFGGINTISSISSNLKISSKSPQNLGNLLIGAAVLGIVLFGIITVLFAGISKIIDKEYELPLLLNILVIATLTVMFLVGCIYTFTANGGWYFNQNIFPLPRVVFSIIVVIVVYRITYIFYKKYKSKQLLDEKSNNGSTSESS